MSPFAAELIGTMFLVLFGNGVVANVVLAKTKGFDAGWILITAGWGVGVFIGAFCAADASGAHLNPAATIAILTNSMLGSGTTFSVAEAVQFITAQMIGAMIGASLVYVFYREHFNVTDDGDAKLACFSTGPEIRNAGQSFVCEVIGTFALMFPVFMIAGPDVAGPDEAMDAPFKLGLGSIGLLPLGLLVFGIGMSLGGTTGYAINPARDLGPRIMHALLPIRNKRDSDWGYAWIPVAGPIVGGVIAAVLYRLLHGVIESTV